MIRITHDPRLTRAKLFDEQSALARDLLLVIVDVERAPTAATTVARFFKTVGFVKAGGNHPSSLAPAFAVRAEGCGLRVDGRSSTFDLFYFPRSNLVAAVDTRDASYVGVAAAPQ